LTTGVALSTQPEDLSITDTFWYPDIDFLLFVNETTSVTIETMILSVGTRTSAGWAGLRDAEKLTDIRTGF
jgi:hypothetical protein